MRSAYFTKNGTWTCPDNTTAILVSGAGGAGGGAGGSGLGFAADGNTFYSGGGGGGGCFEQKTVLSVSPGIVYTIVIGAGGLGGTGGEATAEDLIANKDGDIIVYTTKQLGTDGSDGGATMLLQGSDIIFSINGAGGGQNTEIDIYTELSGTGGKSASGAVGGNGGQAPGSPASMGGDNAINFYLGGAPGDESAGINAGGGGGAGTKGHGGNGGSSGLTTGGDGQDAEPNSGGGGGGGGTIVYTEPPGRGGNGGKGSDGYLYIVW